MTELLLITDIPRLRQVFSRLSDISDIHLRVSTSLESGAKEIVAEKPAIVFVQTHLSGFSAEILLMHLKKQLGRRRTRFVLLCPKGQASEEVLNQYQGYIDTSLDDDLLYDAIIDAVTAAKHTIRNDILTAPTTSDDTPEDTPAGNLKHDLPFQLQKDLPVTVSQLPETPASTSQPETSLEEQGVIYSPRAKLSVYSEFTSSFDDAVSSMPPKEPTSDQAHWSGLHDDAIDIEPAHSRPRWVTFLIWAVPLIAVVIAITMLQQYFSKPKPLDIAPAPITVPPKDNAQPAPIATEKTPATQPAAIAPAELKPVTTRLSRLPEFIPRENRDKEYSKSNPGWERFKGKKTEYKVFRENDSIKAIQVINRDGKGISQALIQDLLKQMVTNPKFVLESTEKKDGYEIQRGRLSEDVTAVYYRDAEDARLRAIVVTWK